MAQIDFTPAPKPVEFTPVVRTPAQNKILDVFTADVDKPKPVDFKPAPKPIDFKSIAQPSKAGTALGDLGTSLKERFVTKPLSETGTYIKQNFTEGVKNVIRPEPVHSARALEQLDKFIFGKSHKSHNIAAKEAKVLDPILTQAQRPLGAVQAITSPLFALEHGYISKPIEETTGGKVKADWVDLARMLTPIGVAAGAGAVTKVLDKVAPETIKAAAIKNGEAIVSAANHDSAYSHINVERGKNPLPEGFVTNRGRFVDRKEAADIALKRGQVDNTYVAKGQLHSEDIEAKQGTPIGQGIAGVQPSIKNPTLLKAAAKEIESWFSPTTISKEAGTTEGIIREHRGIAERDTMQVQKQVDDMSHTVNQLSPESKAGFLNYVESASKGAMLPKVSIEQGKLHKLLFGESPELKSVADSVRKIYQYARTKLEASPHTDKMGFIKDYFPHYWENPEAGKRFITEWFSKTGSTRSTMQRTIPTIADGIAMGLRPKYDNPLDASMKYISDINNHLAIKDIQSSMKDEGLHKFFDKGKQPEGWVELNGPGSEVTYIGGNPEKGKDLYAGIKKAYAPADAARVYNRYLSPGLNGPTYKFLRAAVNGPTQLALALSGYHYRLIAGESMASAYARGFQNLSKGDIAGAAKSFKQGIPFAGVVQQFRKGSAIEKQYLGKSSGMNQQIIDYMTKAGGRVTGIDKTLKNSEANNFWEGWKKGTTKMELAAARDDVRQAGLGINGKPIIPPVARAFFSNVGKLLDTVAYPLFTRTVPMIKNSANYDAIADWVKLNPTASESDILKASRDIIDSTDNRFGELIQDNLFWNKALKNSAQLMVLSMGWDLGTARETVGGMKDLQRYIGKGGDLTPRAAYLIGAPISHMINSMVYQYIKTGTLPSNPQDLVYPPTGGTVTESPNTRYEKKVPERTNIPDTEKDIIGYQENWQEELKNKLAPVWQIAGRMATNQQWNGDPISYEFEQRAPQGVKAYAKYIMDSLTPISIQSIDQRKPGSNIGTLESFLGSRPTGMRGRDPEGYKAMVQNFQKKKEEKGYRDILKGEGKPPPRTAKVSKTGKIYYENTGR
jgi:hypothetical protein